METSTRPIRFRSICPKCARIRPQRGYNRNSLLRLLNGGYPVEAYCAECDDYWSVSVKERVALGSAAIAVDQSLSVSQPVRICSKTAPSAPAVALEPSP